MNALVRKEVRLLWPSCAAATVIMVMPAVLSRTANWPGIASLLFAGAAIPLVTALGAFGREFAAGTFSSMLALPVSRGRLWGTKVLVLASALASFFCLWWISFRICAARWPELGYEAANNNLTPLSSGLFLLTAFSSGLWSTLVFRQVAAAVWFAILIPAAVLLGTLTVVSRFTVEPEHHRLAMIVMALAYSAGGIVWAWRLFARAEDTQWTGGLVTLPRWGFGTQSGENVRRHFRPTAALVWKESQLHHALWWIAGLMAILHVAVIVLRSSGGSLAKHPIVEPLLQVFGGLWLLLPLLAGCAAVAEERKLGIREGQDGQPVGWRRQLLVKLGMVAGLAVAFGAVPPWAIESLAPTSGVFRLDEPDSFWSLRTFIATSAVIAGVAFYASTLARNVLQALGLAIVCFFLGGLLVMFLDWPVGISGRPLWQGSLGRWLGYPIVGLGLAVLAALNFRRPTIAAADWRRNVVVLGSAVVLTVGATSAIYHRAWEWLVSGEPLHGPARLTMSDDVSLRQDGTLSILSKQGELAELHAWPSFVPGVGPTWHLWKGGSNWASVVSLYSDTIAIRRDGTLWVSEFPVPPVIRSTDSVQSVAPLVQFGLETNWTEVVRDWRGGRAVFLLKRDGTLWGWRDTNRSTLKHLPLTASQPRRLGGDSDWARIRSAGFRVYLTKADGRMWCVNPMLRSSYRNSIELEPGLSIHPCPDLEGSEWRSLTGVGMFDLGVKADGTLWAMGVLHWNRSESVILLDDSGDWREVAAGFRFAIALKKDGTLWKLDLERRGGPPEPTRLSRNADWIAVAGSHDLYSLAGDGSIWAWSADSAREGWSAVLGPSRLPRQVGNILSNLTEDLAASR